MDGQARLGRWVLVAVIVATALGEMALAGFNLQAGRFKGSQLVRVLLTAWMFWQVWDGAGWARWLTAGLFLAASTIAAVFGLVPPAAADSDEFRAVMFGLAAVYLAFGVGLASPWVGAYQADRRGDRGA